MVCEKLCPETKANNRAKAIARFKPPIANVLVPAASALIDYPVFKQPVQVYGIRRLVPDNSGMLHRCLQLETKLPSNTIARMAALSPASVPTDHIAWQVGAAFIVL